MNETAINILSRISINFGPVTNPRQTKPTGSFELFIKDDKGYDVEGVSKDIIISPIAGTFELASVTTKVTTINEVSNTFDFLLLPDD